MNKINLLGMEEQRKSLINSLMELGAVEINTVDVSEYEDLAQTPVIQDDILAIETDIAEVRVALDSLNRYCPEKKALFQSRREIARSEFQQVIENEDKVWEAVRKIRDLEERLIQIKAEENKLNNTYTSLIPWDGLPVPVETTGTQRTHFQLGTIPAVIRWDSIEPELSENAPFAEIFRIHSDKDQHYVYVIFHRDIEQECLTYLKSRGFNRMVLQGLSGTVSENLEKLKTRLKILSEESANIIEQIKGMKDERKSLEILYDSISMEQSRTLAMGKVLKTKKTFLIKGWIPEKLSSEAKAQLELKYTVNIELAEPGEDEEFPVLLENKGIAEAGEPVLNMYSLPNCHEIDPNAIMAPFFIIFFGLMMSDGGYGIIMALLAAIILRRFKLEDSMRKFMKLILFCGISTVFWGAMFGSWFGIEALVKYGIWLNPVEQPELLLSWSLLFGVIHIYAGIAIRGANLIRRKKYLDALFDSGFTYIFYTGFIFILLPYVPEIDKVKVAPLTKIGLYMFIVGGVLTLLTQGRGSKSIGGKIGGGFSALYGVTGFMSDILSYSRLLALGLATGIIASIINQMTSIFDLPFIFKMIMVVIISLVGHCINFAINALGAYVHSCRLQYLEFFGKFFTGGGKPFKPLKANTKYIIVKPDADM
ncbi:MAG: V-type ATP synthase subunit I [Clostridiaceae bacterium]